MDYAENADVTRFHSATAREQPEPTTQEQPMPIWVFALCSLFLLAGGALLGSHTNGFGLDTLSLAGYVPQGPDDGSAVVIEKTDLEKLMATGKQIYTTCAACHAPNGSGNPGGNIPPLAGAEWVSGSTERLALIILNGLNGPIEVMGKTWVNNMASQAAAVNQPAKLAGVMTYIRSEFGGGASPVTEEMAEAAFAVSEQYSGQMTQELLLQIPDSQMLPGTPIDMETGNLVGAGDEGASEAAEGQ